MQRKTKQQKIIDFLIDDAAQKIMLLDDDDIHDDDDDAEDEIFDELNEDILTVLLLCGKANPTPSIALNSLKTLEQQSNILAAMDDNRFQQILGVNRKQFAHLLSVLSEDKDFQRENTPQQFSKDLRLAALMAYLVASDECNTLKKIRRFFRFAGNSVMHHIAKRIFKAILNMQSQYISWPDSEERNKIVAATYNELPFCIGYIDVFEVKMLGFAKNCFRKRIQNSIKVQLVCDYKLKIRHVQVGKINAFNIADTYRNSSLFIQKDQHFSTEEWLAAPDSYPLSDNLITPYQSESKYTLNSMRLNFNMRHNKYQQRAKKCIALLKRRFRSLQVLRRIIRTEEQLQQCYNWILVCCILHNIFLENAECEQYLADSGTFNDSEQVNNDFDSYTNDCSGQLTDFEAKRNALCAFMFGKSMT